MPRVDACPLGARQQVDEPLGERAGAATRRGRGGEPGGSAVEVVLTAGGIGRTTSSVRIPLVRVVAVAARTQTAAAESAETVHSRRRRSARRPS
ncbi:hypothetical protein TR74_08840 [Carbonactinospora thermoautotrophica]|uniref:Uncharacterized protein n=1 Tax=Carbonactinospora thermoautotrophica TaxID=1469144 RepID=A0A132NIM4_9ACTN|nr:hypothetical protein [Carbonactinospora thermoautotrophica]KWX09562.1 hypothetical protein TR74_08840 [Carbonactinospora thermoautotrophica]